MDARTFEPKNQILNYLHINMIAFIYNNLNGGITFSPTQKWFYYSRQTPLEVLVFHQYTKVNFHIRYIYIYAMYLGKMAGQSPYIFPQ